MSPENQKMERLERQMNSLRRKQIFDRVEIPKVKYEIPSNKGMASKTNTKRVERIVKEISISPITKATTNPVHKEPVMDNSKQNILFLIFLKYTICLQTLRILGHQLRKFLSKRKQHIKLWDQPQRNSW